MPASDKRRALDWWVRKQNPTSLTDEEYAAMAAAIPADQHDLIVAEYRDVRDNGIPPIAGQPVIVMQHEVVLRENDNAREQMEAYAKELREAADQLDEAAKQVGKTFTVREAYDKRKLQRSKLTGVVSVVEDEEE